MTCIYTGDDCSYCTCSTCSRRRTPLEHGRRAGVVVPTRPFVHRRRRPCPTGIPGDLDGVVPYQPSRCAKACTCCRWCRGDQKPERNWCTCPIQLNWSNCERGHSELVECRGGCKPRPIAMAVVVEPPGRLERALRWVGKALRAITRGRA